jgi:hypothetical protein
MSDSSSPRAHLAALVAWATLNLSAAAGHAALLAVSLALRRRRQNILLLHLEAVFVLSCLTGSMLIWTGYALDTHPPPGLCLANAAMALANVPAQAGVALGIVLKVWTNTMLVDYPGSSLLECMASTPLVRP